MKEIAIFVLLGIIFFSCTNKNGNSQTEGEVIDFGNLGQAKASKILTNYNFVELETNDSCLIGYIDKIEVYKDKIYIQDSYGSHSILVFTMHGKHIATLSNKGNGPGEFISPDDFFIDSQGYLLVLDRMQSRLLKYRLDDLAFVEEISMPLESPVSVSYMDLEGLYLYYYPQTRSMGEDKRQIFAATPNGEIKSRYLDLGVPGKVLYGGTRNFYTFNNRLIFYPSLSDKLYEATADSARCRYSLVFGENKIPDQNFFNKFTSQDKIMDELLGGSQDFICHIIAYESKEVLLVNYYVKKDFYCGMWFKKERKSLNFYYEDVDDDLGIGGKFPRIVGMYDNQFIGRISLSDIDIDFVKEPQLKALLSDYSEDNNPVLVFFTPGL